VIFAINVLIVLRQNHDFDDRGCRDLIQTPANIGDKDLSSPKHNSAEQLAKDWSDARDQDLNDYLDDEGKPVRGACDISPDYFDPRGAIPNVSAHPLPWNSFVIAFRRCLWRWVERLIAALP